MYDPWANAELVKHEYGLQITNELPNERYDAVVLAVAHESFKKIDILDLLNDVSVVYDVKGVLDRDVIDMRL